MPDPFGYEIVQLDRDTVYAQQYVSSQLRLSGVDLRVVQQQALDAMIYQLKAYVYKDNLPPESVTVTKEGRFDRPATWWDHWKLDHKDKWYGRWLFNRYGVNHVQETVTVEARVDLKRFQTYPEAKIPEEFGFGPGYNSYQIAVFKDGVQVSDFL